MLEKDKVRWSCDMSEEGEQLLSQRVDKLVLKGLPVKSLSSLQAMLGEQTIRTTAHPKLQLPPKKMKKSKKDKSVASLNHSRSRPSPPKVKYDLEDGRMLQLTQGKGGQTMVSEVRHAKVREFSGRGVLVFPNDKKFEGEWVDGLLIGKAKITHPNGDTYIGDTYNFMRHGRGTLLYTTGQKYEGQFSSGDFHGEGILYDREGKLVYDGEWRRGKKYER